MDYLSISKSILPVAGVGDEFYKTKKDSWEHWDEAGGRKSLEAAFTMPKHTTQLPSTCLHCDCLLEDSFWPLEPTMPKLERARELMLLEAALYQ